MTEPALYPGYKYLTISFPIFVYKKMICKKTRGFSAGEVALSVKKKPGFFPVPQLFVLHTEKDVQKLLPRHLVLPALSHDAECLKIGFPCRSVGTKREPINSQTRILTQSHHPVFHFCLYIL